MREEIRDLYKKSYELWLDAVKMVYHAKTSHAAPSLSMVDLITAAYFYTLKLDPADPGLKDGDRFVLPKGHACPIYYAVSAKRGFFPEKDLMEYRKLNSSLQEHPDMCKCPGVDMTTGSLGNGLAASLEMALIGKKNGSSHYVYVICGDKEPQGGIAQESAMYTGDAHLGHLTWIVDCNGLQSGGGVADIQDLGNPEVKFKGFGWDTRTIDGHNMEEILDTVTTAKAAEGASSVIIVKTVKGEGVSYMEDRYLWHMKAPNDEEYKIAVGGLVEEVGKYE